MPRFFAATASLRHQKLQDWAFYPTTAFARSVPARLPAPFSWESLLLRLTLAPPVAPVVEPRSLHPSVFVRTRSPRRALDLESTQARTALLAYPLRPQGPLFAAPSIGPIPACTGRSSKLLNFYANQLQPSTTLLAATTLRSITSYRSVAPTYLSLRTQAPKRPRTNSRKAIQIRSLQSTGFQ